MNIPELKVVVGTLADAYDAGCDTVQLKHPGGPVTLDCVDGRVNISWRHKFENAFIMQLNADEHFNGVFLATKTVQDIYMVHDCIEMNGVDLKQEPYRVRYVQCKANVTRLGPMFCLVPSHPIIQAGHLWRTEVVPNDLNGLVCRRSMDDVWGTLWVMRHYKEAPGELV